jgi:predicted DCC family thiol-disulfide oxidoreductase YuxK
MEPAPQPTPIPPRLVLFDGVCGLCSKTVQFMLDHDPENRLSYAPLQGETAAALRREHPEIPDELATIVFVEEGRVWLYSDAIVRLAPYLGAPWRWAAAGRVLPRAVRDVFYRAIANNRYKVWGKYESCRIPAPGQMERFLP